MRIIITELQFRKLTEDLTSYSEKKTPSEICMYVNSLHTKGWEKAKFDDCEWIEKDDYYQLEKVEIGDKRFKWNYGQHPPIAHKYAKLETEIPAIVISSNGFIIDGTHRVGAARLKGKSYILAYIGKKEN